MFEQGLGPNLFGFLVLAFLFAFSCSFLAFPFFKSGWEIKKVRPPRLKKKYSAPRPGTQAGGDLFVFLVSTAPPLEVWLLARPWTRDVGQKAGEVGASGAGRMFTARIQPKICSRRLFATNF